MSGPSLVVATMIRDEADRYLPSVLSSWSQFSDGILVLDDGSEDDSAELCRDHGATVVELDSTTGSWGRESHIRRRLFEAATNSDHDWILWLDADMIPANDPKDLISPVRDHVLFRLFDLWSVDSSDQLLYRSDRYWYAHRTFRTWMIRSPSSTFEPIWRDRGIHCGHLPQNLQLTVPTYAPISHSLLHYGYLRDEDKSAKLDQYLSVREQLTETEIEHAKSIGDRRPRLERLPITPRWPLKFSAERQLG